MRDAARILLAASSLMAPANAYETDQFTHRESPIADSTEVLNREMNAAIADVIRDWDREGPDRRHMVQMIFRRVGGYFWIDQLERWAGESAEVERLPPAGDDSIYAGHPFWATRVTTFAGVGATLKLGGQLVGTDKIGHFLSQGRKIYFRYERMGDEERAVARAAFAEKAIFGTFTTGNFSNADIVANYEGHRFYRSLFEDGIVEGEPAILRWESDGWVQQRDFDWRDHVTEFWDEALFPNHFDRLLEDRIRERLRGYCDDYRRAPEVWSITPDRWETLWARYAFIGIVDTRDMTLPVVCGEDV